MRRLVIVPLVAGAALISSILATPAFSQSGEVPATITAGTPCLTVSSDTLAFPSKVLSSSVANSVSEMAGPSVANCSTLSEIISISSTDAAATGQVPWDLINASSLAAAHCGTGGELLPRERFVLNYYESALKQVLVGNGEAEVGTLAASVSLPAYSLQLVMPCTGTRSVGAEMSFTITFIASAP